jgi:hypothetical protein
MLKSTLILLVSLAVVSGISLPHSRRDLVRGLSVSFFGGLGARPAAALVTPYCVPGVTAERCRGTFWESGQLYRKDDSEGGFTSIGEYERAVASLAEARKRLGGLVEGDSRAVGAAAFDTRLLVRKTGGRVCASLAEEERYDSEFRLKELIAALGDLDTESLRTASSAQAETPLAFTTAGLLLDTALKRFDAFLGGVPTSPTAE